jgi:flagellar protein FlaG
MIIEPVSNAVYHDIAKTAQNSANKMADINPQSNDAGTMNISITETPASVRSQSSSQYDSERDKQQKDNCASEQQIRAAIKKANGHMKARNTKCEFSYHEKINTVSIKIIDQDTEEVIREIPPEEAMEMVEKMWEIAGLLVDEKR